MSPAFIQKRLPWLGNSFKMYLQDTLAIQNKHTCALRSASADVMALLATPPKEVVRLTGTMSEITVADDANTSTGGYMDEMD
jgi:hypothetical protein